MKLTIIASVIASSLFLTLAIPSTSLAQLPDNLDIRNGWSDLKVSDIQIFESELRTDGPVSDETSLLSYRPADQFISFYPVASNYFALENTGSELKSNGNLVTIERSGNRFFGIADGKIIFKLALEHNGQYEFTLYETLDHDEVDGDTISLNFTLQGQNPSGRILGGAKIVIDVFDDTPDLSLTYCYFYQDHLAGQPHHSVNGILQSGPNTDFDFGADGAGKIHFVENGHRFFLGFADEERNSNASTESVELFSNGETVIIETKDNSITGSVSTGTVFTLKIDRFGRYSYTQFNPIDHPQYSSTGRSFDNQMNMGFEVHVHDGDEDISETELFILVMDEGAQTN